MLGNLRKPAVAGTFYSSNAAELLEEVKGYIADGPGKPEAKVFGCICPHAGYYYSGHVAGAVLSCVEVPDRVILLGPNHRGIGKRGAISDSGGWEFPFGVVPVDEDLSRKLSAESSALELDSAAHAQEHSLEVIVPFLYARNPNLSIAAISISAAEKSELQDMAKAVALCAESSGALICASTDMTHYQPDETVRAIDSATIELIKALDVDGLISKVAGDSSMCGVWPVAVAIMASVINGAAKAELVRYATSGDIGNKRESVVGYAGFTICG